MIDAWLREAKERIALTEEYAETLGQDLCDELGLPPTATQAEILATIDRTPMRRCKAARETAEDMREEIRDLRKVEIEAGWIEQWATDRLAELQAGR